MTDKIVFIKSGTTWRVPDDFSNVNRLIAIGGGGGGGVAFYERPGGGGGACWKPTTSTCPGPTFTSTSGREGRALQTRPPKMAATLG